jgi:hypothetical protein
VIPVELAGLVKVPELVRSIPHDETQNVVTVVSHIGNSW